MAGEDLRESCLSPTIWRRNTCLLEWYDFPGCARRECSEPSNEGCWIMAELRWKRRLAAKILDSTTDFVVLSKPLYIVLLTASCSYSQVATEIRIARAVSVHQFNHHLVQVARHLLYPLVLNR
ncbi:hypothetical protein GQ43DRAFT_239340 [Delitschia confertaspora ATCC 74209]|uniref:Uncharacterized protein n=1 Tax=Delitschia confertaspora ATCC 74209 TaxID=1513339 RepID=A0A9P4MY09_9PLEO|nr:hypothetical protein GQ43DRAFT_239340 [Delitschia confertaspora ATCC 74209]